MAGSVLLERALGGAATLALAAVGFALAVGRYDVGAYLWIEALFVVATIVLGFVLFSRSLRRPLARLVPLLRRLRLERPVRALYEGMHAFRDHAALLGWITALTLAVQAVRVLAIWLAGKSAGVELSPRIYYVMGPMLFLVLLVPFTINGLAVREAFFVSFLGTVGVDRGGGVRDGFPVLPRDRPAGAPGRARARLGRAPRRRAAIGRGWVVPLPALLEALPTSRRSS